MSTVSLFLIIYLLKIYNTVATGIFIAKPIFQILDKIAVGDIGEMGAVSAKSGDIVDLTQTGVSISSSPTVIFLLLSNR